MPISARLPDEDEQALDEVVALLGEDRSTVIREALREGLADLRIREAVARYQTGAVSINQAARIAGVSVADWLLIAHDRNLTSQLSPEALDSDAETASRL